MKLSLTHGLSAVTAAALISPAFAGGENWTDNYAQAQETAAQENKDLLLDFTGSDWCGWCIRLNEEVFSHDEFKDFANEHLVLVELDYPREKQLSEEVVAQNQTLKERYAIRGYPTIFLTDAAGRPYAQTGYQAGGPEAYVEHLQGLMAVREQRDAGFAAAEEATGVEKAQHLHEGLQAVGDDLAVKFYGPIVDQIMELDADNAAGLRGHYEMLALAQEQRTQLEAIVSGNLQAEPQQALDALDELLADDALTPPIRQESLMWKSQIHMFILNDKEGAKPLLEQAIAVDPESEMGRMLQGAYDQHFGASE